MEQVQEKRISHLDTAKGWLILLVAAGHILIVLNPGYDRLLLTAAQEFINAFHMPAFFVIHGMLLANTKTHAPWGDLLRKRIRTTMVPYLFFETLGMALRWALYGQSLKTGVYNLLTIRCNVGADWFLPALLMGSVGASAWHRYGNRTWGWISAAAALILTMLLPRTQMGIVLARGLMGYVFIVLGMLIPRRVFVPEKRTPVWFGVCFAVTALCAVINLKYGGNDFYGGRVGNPATLLLGGLWGTGWVLMLSRWSDCGVLQTVGRESLVIMGTHQLVIYAMTAWLPGMRGGSLLWGAALALLMAAFELVIVPAANRFFPRLVGKTRNTDRKIQ